MITYGYDLLKRIRHYALTGNDIQYEDVPVATRSGLFRLSSLGWRTENEDTSTPPRDDIPKLSNISVHTSESESNVDKTRSDNKPIIIKKTSPAHSYAMFCWLCPLFFVVVCLIAESAYEYNDRDKHNDFSYGSRALCGILGDTALNYTLGVFIFMASTYNLSIVVYVEHRLRKLAEVADNTYVRFTQGSSCSIRTSMNRYAKHDMIYATPLKSLKHVDQSLVWHLWTYFVLSALFGIPWLIGIVSAMSEVSLFWTLFFMTNSIAGFILFGDLVVSRTQVLMEFFRKYGERKKTKEIGHVDNSALVTIATCDAGSLEPYIGGSANDNNQLNVSSATLNRSSDA